MRKQYKKKDDESLVSGLQGVVSTCKAVSKGVTWFTEHHVTIMKPERPGEELEVLDTNNLGRS